MMKHAVEIGLRADDPTQDVRAIRVKSDGFHSWTEPRLVGRARQAGIARSLYLASHQQ